MGESPRPSRWTDIKLPIGRFENFLKNHDDENPLRSDRQSISIILSSKIIVRSNRAPVPCWVSRISRRRGSRLRALSCCIAFAKGNSISNTSASSVKRSRKYGTRYSPHKHRRHQDSSRSHFLKFAREPFVRPAEVISFSLTHSVRRRSARPPKPISRCLHPRYNTPKRTHRKTT